MRVPCLVQLAVLLIICNTSHLAQSISFSLRAGTKKCFMDGAKNDIPVKGEYSVSHNDRFAVKLTVS